MRSISFQRCILRLDGEETGFRASVDMPHNVAKAKYMSLLYSPPTLV